MKRKFLGIFLSMLILLQICIIPSYADGSISIADDFSNYADEVALSKAFSKDEGDSVTQITLESPENSPYGNALKITENSPVEETWYNVNWNTISARKLSGKIQANFSVYIDGGVNTYREFAIKGGNTEISFLSFRNGNILRVNPSKITEAKTEFTTPATYEANTWYNVEFKYDINTSDYYVAVSKAKDNSIVAAEKLNLKSLAADKYKESLGSLTTIDGFSIQSRRDDGEVSGPAVYIDNLSMKNISVNSIFDENIEENFESYEEAADLANSFIKAENDSVTQITPASPGNSPYGNALKITEISPADGSWYSVNWNTISARELSGKIQANFFVYMDGNSAGREFAIHSGSTEISFLSFRDSGKIMRVDPTKITEARTDFTTHATYEINTWYNVEFKYDLNTSDYYVAVSKAKDNSIVAAEKLNLKSVAADKYKETLDSLTTIDGFSIQSRRNDGEASGPAVYIDNLSIKNISVNSIFDENIEEDFESYEEAADLANSFIKAENDSVTQITPASPADSPYGNALKITEISPAAGSWYSVNWNTISARELSGKIQANFSVYIDGAVTTYREFAIYSGSTEISFLSFRSGQIMRVDPAKITEARTQFTYPATYKANTWYNVEFKYDLNTSDYYVAVRKAEDNSIVAKETLNLKSLAADKYKESLGSLTTIDGFNLQSRRDDGEVSGPVVYIDNLSMKNIFVNNIFDENIEEDFESYEEAADLANAFSKAEDTSVAQITLASPVNSPYGNALKISESEASSYNVKWDTISGINLNGKIQLNFSVYTEEANTNKSFSVYDGTNALSFITFYATDNKGRNQIRRVREDKVAVSSTGFTSGTATYEIETWYNVEFKYDLDTGFYHIAVRKAEDDSLVAEEKLVLAKEKISKITKIDGFGFASTVSATGTAANGSSVYIDNLSIKNIGIADIDSLYVAPVAYTLGAEGETLTVLEAGDVTSWVTVAAIDDTADIDLKAYLALYKDGSLDKVKILPITSAGKHPVQFDDAITLAEGSEYILRTYVWSGDTLIPWMTDAGISN